MNTQAQAPNPQVQAQMIQNLHKTVHMHEMRAQAANDVIAEANKSNIELRAAQRISENNLNVANARIAMFEKQFAELAAVHAENVTLRADVERLNRVVAAFDRKLGNLLPVSQDVGDEDTMEQPAPLKVVEHK